MLNVDPYKPSSSQRAKFPKETQRWKSLKSIENDMKNEIRELSSMQIDVTDLENAMDLITDIRNQILRKYFT